MDQTERELFFKESEQENTLSGVEVEKLVFSPHGNHKRSLVGDKWFYFGETEEEYSLFHDEVVNEDDSHVYILMYENGELLIGMPIAIWKTDYEKIYPIQPLFPFPMQSFEAESILKEYFLGKIRTTP